MRALITGKGESDKIHFEFEFCIRGKIHGSFPFGLSHEQIKSGAKALFRMVGQLAGIGFLFVEGWRIVNVWISDIWN